MQPSLLARTAPGFALTALCAALLCACGGGGGDASIDSSGTSADTATIYAADATVVASDATAALDTAAATAQAVVSMQATATAASASGSANAADSPMTEALSVKPMAVASVPVACPGGGSATLSITGGSATSVLNGTLDTGEVYQIVFANCKSAAGAAAVNGTLAMTVNSATGTSLSVTMVATDLGVALPNGSVVLAGSTTRQASSSVDVSGATQLSSHVTTPSLTLTTHYNARNSSFTLSAVDVTRQSTWANGLPQSSSMSGTHTLTAALASGSFSYTVSTQGSVSYSSAGVPTAGTWSISLPATVIGVSVGSAVATITVDDGKDGTIDRTVSVPVSRLQTEVG